MESTPVPAKLKIVLLLFVVLVGLDQASKVWVVRSLALGRDELTLVPGLLSFVHAQNPGAAMGLFTSFAWRLPLFLVFTAVALGVLWSMYRQIADNDRLQAAMVGCILAGAVGNLIDRVHKQTVTDFIRVYTDSPSVVGWLASVGLPAEWPTFNVADMAIVVGVGLYVIHYLLVERKAAAAVAPRTRA